MSKKKYLIIEESDVIALSNRVSNLIDEGYIPFGSLVVSNSCNHNSQPLFCQAMILKDSS